MLHEIGVQLAQALGARGCGFDVIDGPERRPTVTFARERVVIEHDTAADSFESRHRADTRPRTRMTRVMACKLTIYAKAPGKGAAEWEHRRRAETVLDLCLIALDIIAKERANLWTPKGGKFIYPDDLKPSETPGGAIYELTFTFDRGVANRTFPASVTGTGQPTSGLGDAANDDGSTTQTTTITGDGTGVAIKNSYTVEIDEPGFTDESVG